MSRGYTDEHPYSPQPLVAWNTSGDLWMKMDRECQLYVIFPGDIRTNTNAKQY
jgi:hypothetical protein